MKKNILLMSAVLFSMLVYGQVGVDTAFPKALFHVDGGKDNPKDNTTVLTSAQEANDFTVTKEGKVGVGVVNPDTFLHINNGTTNGAIKIVDGTQAAGKVLISDVDGVGTWQLPNSFKPIALGVYPNPGVDINSDGTDNSFGAVKYSQVYLTVSKGRWIVNAGLTVRTTSTAAKQRFWMHSYLSTSQTALQQVGFNHLGPAGNNTSYANLIFTNPSTTSNPYTHQGSNFISGSSIIEVTSATPITIYLLIDNSNALPTSNGEKVGSYTFGTGAYENYFYAIPVE